MTVVGGPRVTFVGEMLGRRLESLGRLAELVRPHARLAAVETIRLTGVSEPTHHLMAVGGVKWNVAGTWLLTASITRPLTSAGLTARVIPLVVAEYSFGQ